MYKTKNRNSMQASLGKVHLGKICFVLVDPNIICLGNRLYELI